MKTKITAVAVVLAVAMAATAVAANLFASARTIPIPKQGDPMQGVTVKLIATSGTKPPVVGKTNENGVVTFTGIAWEEIDIFVNQPPPTSSNYNSSRSNTAGITCNNKAAGTIIFGKEPGKLRIKLQQPGPWTIEVTAKEGPDPKPTPTPKPRS